MKLTNPIRRWTRGRSAARGFTLVELMISVFISGLVMMAVASLMFISARTIKEMYGQTRTRSSRMRALDQIRYRLANAQIGSLTEFQAEYIDTDGDGIDDELVGFHRIEFVDPTHGGVTSAFIFTPSNYTLSYDVDVNDTVSAITIVEGPIDITFEAESAEVIAIKVKTASTNTYGGDVDTQDGEMKVYLRNIPPAF